MTETGSGVVYDGRPLEGVEIAFRPSSPRSSEGEGGAAATAEAAAAKARSCSAPRCCCGATATEPTGESQGPTACGTGSPPVMPAGSAPTAGSTCRAAWPMSSPPARRRCGPTRSSASCWRIPASPRWRSGSGPIPSGASGSWPGSCPPATRPSLDELREMVADGLAPWAAPKELVLVDDLPRTAAGKVRRRELESSESLSASGRRSASQARSSAAASRSRALEPFELVRIRHGADAHDRSRPGCRAPAPP